MSAELEKVQQQIASLQKKAESLITEERGGVIEEIKNKLELYNITPQELGIVGRTPRTNINNPVKQKVAPKYKLSGKTWTGRGRQPKWVANYVASNGKLEDLLIK